MTIDGVIIKGRRGRILGSYYRADVPEDGGRLPVVILCHGFPGNDQFLDFAYLLQEHGYHVMTFEYSGSWGSDGDYSLRNVIEDTETVLDWIVSNRDDSVDKDRIYLLCHSLGGFAGVNIFSKRQEIAAGVFVSPANITDIYEEAGKNSDTLQKFAAEMDEFCLPLRGVDGAKIVAEIQQYGETFRFENVAGGFGTRPVLLVKGTQDTITPAAVCTDVIARMQDAVPGNQCQIATYDAPHDYMNVRRQLRERVLEFFESVSDRTVPDGAPERNVPAGTGMQIQILELIGGARSASGLAVIIDVFRAFSLEAYLFGQGAEEIFAVRDVEQAFALKAEHPDWLLAGERGGRKVDGFDFGNSPSAFAGRDLTGRTVVHTTSAGTQGLAAAANADEIVTGSLVNARAVAEYILSKQPKTVSLVAMGNSGIETAQEDVLCAKYIKSVLENHPMNNIQTLADALAGTAGKKFFDPAQADVFPKKDFALCTACDRFSFVIRAKEEKNGIFRMMKCAPERPFLFDDSLV